MMHDGKHIVVKEKMAESARWAKVFRRIQKLLPYPVFFLLISGCGRQSIPIDVSMYDFRDTRCLVRLVAEAVDTIERGGIEAIKERKSDFIIKGLTYVYVYDMDHNCLFHAGMPNLVGKNLSGLKDLKGRPLSKLISNALDNPDNPHAWVHYNWWEPGSFYSVPKSSCHLKARLPDGRQVFVGGGIDYPHEEKEFIRIIVDSAVRLISREGIDNAIKLIADPRSEFHYRDVSVFIMLDNGLSLLSPVLSETPFDMNLLDFVDGIGNHPFKLAIKNLAASEATWQIFMTHSRTERQMVKKIICLRKCSTDRGLYYVGAATDLPQPP